MQAPIYREQDQPFFPEGLGVPDLLERYSSGSLTPSQVVQELYPLLEKENGAFITLAPLEQLLDTCRCHASSVLASMFYA